MDRRFRSSLAFVLGGGMLIGVGGCNIGEPGASSPPSGGALQQISQATNPTAAEKAQAKKDERRETHDSHAAD